MIQRYLYNVLKAGLAAVAKDPTILDELFQNLYGLDATEMAAIHKLFVEKPPVIMHGYARADATFPLYSIVLQNEGEKDLLIGDDAGMDDEHNDVYAAMWEHTYQILCYSQHPDATLYMYELAKTFLLTYHDYFVEKDLYAIRVSGTDLHPDERYLPGWLFVRQLTFSCEREFNQVSKVGALGKAFKVNGIFIDKAGSPSDPGAVKTLVVPISGNEEEEE